ncbi:MAG: hypothetical protein ACR2PL_08430, partial [Dehalococcoidia bacterium]
MLLCRLAEWLLGALLTTILADTSGAPRGGGKRKALLKAEQLTPGGKVFGYLPPFDADACDVILEPPGSG